MNKIQEIKELIEKAEVQVELFQMIQLEEKSNIHNDVIIVLERSIKHLTKYLEELSGQEVWSCCGNKFLTHDENCPVCGDKYKESVYED